MHAAARARARAELRRGLHPRRARSRSGGGDEAEAPRFSSLSPSRPLPPSLSGTIYPYAHPEADGRPFRHFGGRHGLPPEHRPRASIDQKPVSASLGVKDAESGSKSSKESKSTEDTKAKALKLFGGVQQKSGRSAFWG